LADQLAARVSPRGLSHFVQFYLPLLAYETVMGVPERMAVPPWLAAITVSLIGV
jgi:hypothetical protein